MHIRIEISVGKIAELFTTAIEGGDPVTTASRGGWCSGIYWRSRDLADHKIPAGCWYSNPQSYVRNYRLEVIEIDDETTGSEVRHHIGKAQVARGLRTMAEKFPDQFSQIIKDEIDAPCADIFLQCILFGDEKYA